MSPTVVNFGGNVRSTPRRRAAPRTEAEILELLGQAPLEPVRVMGALHSWSPLIETQGLLLDLRYFREIEILGQPGAPRVRVGAGCRLKTLLRELRRCGYTLPSLGLITEQTVAGAVATGTHGSGRHSLSHYVLEARIATFGPGPDLAPRMMDLAGGRDLRAVRCSLGLMGVVTSLTLPLVPAYRIDERLDRLDRLSDVLALEAETPLQQFYLIPHAWDFIVQARKETPQPRRGLSALLYRAYWFLALDVGLHLVIKLLASVLRSRWAIRAGFRGLLPRLVLKGRSVVDASERMLVMEHELFRHLEMELFVPAVHLKSALGLLTSALRVADDAGTHPPDALAAAAARAGQEAALEGIRGSFTHHYPICIRKVLPDDTLISMTSGDQIWYAISLITYVEPRDPFLGVCRFLAHVMAAEFGARPHWGKWMPLTRAEVSNLYPGLDAFRDVCRTYDPTGRFRNAFTEDVVLASPPE